MVLACNFIVGLLYSVYFHARWGQTLGKRLARIRVINLDGSPIGWTTALRRFSVYIALNAGLTVFAAMALSQVDPMAFASAGWMERQEMLSAHSSGITTALDNFTNVWIVSAGVVVLFNRRRRALHDFIGGTVMVGVAPSFAAVDAVHQVSGDPKEPAETPAEAPSDVEPAWVHPFWTQPEAVQRVYVATWDVRAAEQWAMEQQARRGAP